MILPSSVAVHAACICVCVKGSSISASSPSMAPSSPSPSPSSPSSSPPFFVDLRLAW